MKRLVILFLFLSSAALIGAVAVKAFEIPQQKWWICHREPRKQDISLYLDWNGAYNGHIKKHDDDYWGKCKEEEPTPTPTPTNTPTPTDIPDEEPTSTPSATYIPVVPRSENKPEGCTQGCQAPVCTAEIPAPVENFHVYRNGDTAILKWIPKEGNKVNIYYKENSSGDWQYSVIGVENTGYYEIGGLGSLDVTFAIEAVNDCMPSPKASFMAMVVDAITNVWTLFR